MNGSSNKNLGSLVDDEETLYRRVPVGCGYWKQEQDLCRVTSAAFGDRSNQCSVDRAKLIENDLNRTANDISDGVVSLTALDARWRQTDGQVLNKVEENKLADVIENPITDNFAHALIIVATKSDDNSGVDKQFKKLKHRLARICKVLRYGSECT